MSGEKEDPVVPLGPSQLCFDSSCFVKDSFSVDKFLKDHRNKANLETMRDDLGIYLKVLRSALIDLINKDYADFVNLSSNLIGLDKAMKKIQTPMGQLREELLEVRSSLDSALNEIKTQLIVRHELREKKRSLRSLSHVHSSLQKLKTILSSARESEPVDFLILERAASEFCQLQFHVEKCNKDLTTYDLEDFETVGNLLIDCVNKIFLEAISSGENGRLLVTKSLTFYHTLNKIEHAERFYRYKIVAPIMDKLISENSLKSLPRGLPALYEKILEFLDEKMKILCEVSVEFNTSVGENAYKFFLRSLWPEVVERLEVELPSIYAAGNPDVFYLRYSETLSFLEILFKRCDTETRIELYNHSSFNSFMDKWSLPVYFQLRFQEIVKEVENGLNNNDWMSKSEEWKLLGTEKMWSSLHRCWEPGVYLFPLAHKFYKLSLQIISRYITWTKDVTKPKTENGKFDINFLVYLHTDIESLIKNLVVFESFVLKQIPSLSEQTRNNVERSLEESGVLLKNELKNVSESVVRFLCGESISILRQVNDIPRLFRRTNREAPSKPCQYILTLLESPRLFQEKHKDNPNALIWLQSMFSSVTKSYYSSVNDVLNSVQKTEESIRRLKKARDRTTNILPNDKRVGDDNKIRLQLHLDVHAYLQGIENFGLKRSSIDQLNDLIVLVEASQKQ